MAKTHLPILDCTSDHWWRARRNGRWEALSPRVLRLRGAPESDSQRALAAVLDTSPGAVLHGRSALAWFGLRGYDLSTLHVARPRGISGTPANLARLHWLRDLRAHDVAVVRGVPTETPLRAIWTRAAQFASRRAPDRADLGVRVIGRLLDEAHRRGLVSWAALHEAVGNLRARGRAGTVIMRALAADRPPGSSPTESRNENRLEEVLGQAGLPPMRRQVVAGGFEPIGRVDFRDRDLPLVLEVNSQTFHSAPTDREADTVRYRRFNDVGFTVAVVWEEDLWSRPRAVGEVVRQARTEAREGRASVLHSPACPWPATSFWSRRCDMHVAAP